MSGSHPRPYVPRLLRPAQVVPDRAFPRKPWMDLPDAHHRCYRCGHHEADLAVLNEHEDHCKTTEES